MNISPIAYELDKEYRQRQELRAKKDWKLAVSQKKSKAKSVGFLAILSQIFLNLK